MPRKKRTSKLRPKTPSRIKKRRPATKKPRSLQHPELWGLGFVALGAFLASVVYFGWNGGYVGRALADGLDSVVGRASWGLPVLLVVLGCLMVARSALVDVRPFRTGLVVLVLGLMIALGRDQGGYLGQMLGGGVGARARRDRHDHPRDPAAARRHAAPHRRLARRDPPPLRARDEDGGGEGAPAAPRQPTLDDWPVAPPVAAGPAARPEAGRRRGGLSRRRRRPPPATSFRWPSRR